MTTTYAQQQLTLPSLGRGSHLITPHITSALSSSSSTAPISNIKHGLLHLFLQHTSCALTLNENWDEDVRADMSDALDGIAPEDTVRYSKTFESPVDVLVENWNRGLWKKTEEDQLGVSKYQWNMAQSAQDQEDPARTNER